MQGASERNAIHVKARSICFFVQEQTKRSEKAEGAEAKANRKRVGSGVDDYGEAGSSDDSGDEFYDRSKSGGASAGPSGGRKKSKEAVKVVETAEGLYGKR